MASVTAPTAAPELPADQPTRRRWVRPDWTAIRAVVAKDLTAVSRSKAVVIPMLAVPVLLLIVLPLGIGLAAQGKGVVEGTGLLDQVPGGLADEIGSLPPNEQLVVLVNGYLLAPLFLIVPLMVSAVLAADAFAGEKERKTLEGLLHHPLSDRDLFLAKLATAYVPAVLVSWIGFVLFAIVANSVSWNQVGRVFVPTRLWLVVILWIAPAVAATGLGIMVRVSARVRTSQEANQLGGAVILPLIFLAVGQSTGLLLVTVPVALGVGVLLWAVALLLIRGGARRFTRDALAARL
jgi:hypothetical protein